MFTPILSQLLFKGVAENDEANIELLKANCA